MGAAVSCLSGVSCTLLNSQDSAVPASEPRESSLLCGLQPPPPGPVSSSGGPELESDEGKSLLASLGGLECPWPRRPCCDSGSGSEVRL